MTHSCSHPNCTEEGLFPAPRSRTNLRDHIYFCLQHIREYNARWNFFEGYSEQQMYDQMKRDVHGDRPTWVPSSPLVLEKRLHDFIREWTRDTKRYQKPVEKSLNKEAQALETLGLTVGASVQQIKKRYRELVKRYHPDKNPDNPKAAERFKMIAEAYSVLQNRGQIL